MLIDNAVKYNNNNGKVDVKLTDDKENVFIEISDTGIGIDNKKLTTILEPFIQVEDEGYKRRFEGAGLGLTIAYKLTIEMKGKFDIQSEPGSGTRVKLSFPKSV